MSDYKKNMNDRMNDEMEEHMDRDMGGDDRRPRKFSGNGKRKKCRFTTGEEDVANVNYKNPRFLSTFMTEHGKIVPRRVTGNAAHIQRHLAQEIKRARALALLGFVAIGPNGAN